MSKSLLIGAVVVLLVGGGIWYVTQNQQAELPQETQTPQETPQIENNKTNEQPAENENARQIITYTNEGYTPKTLAIKQGETVIFRNESSGDMWPASAPHPAHTIYPEFDAKRAIPAGETYEFTFTRTGSWNFHNHLNPTKFGTITVE